MSLFLLLLGQYLLSYLTSASSLWRASGLFWVTGGFPDALWCFHWCQREERAAEGAANYMTQSSVHVCSVRPWSQMSQEDVQAGCNSLDMRAHIQTVWCSLDMELINLDLLALAGYCDSIVWDFSVASIHCQHIVSKLNKKTFARQN